MAVVSSVNESFEKLTDFFQMLDSLFTHIQETIFLTDFPDLQHCKLNLDQSFQIVTAILFAVNNNISNGHYSGFQFAYGREIERLSISRLFEELINVLEREMDNIAGFVHSPTNEGRRAVTSFLPSTGRL